MHARACLIIRSIRLITRIRSNTAFVTKFVMAVCVGKTLSVLLSVLYVAVPLAQANHGTFYSFKSPKGEFIAALIM